ISNFTLTGVAPCRAIKHLIVYTVSGWIAASGSEFQTSEVQAGENVTLQWPRIYKYDVMTFWFRLVNGTTVNSIVVKSNNVVNYNAEFQPGKFEMTQNTSDVFLKIKQVDVSDSGLYFCGYFSEGRLNLRVMQLKVGGKIIVKSFITLGGLSVFLLMVIIGLVVQNMKLQTGTFYSYKINPGSDEVNYAAVTVRPKPKRREIEPNVIYASTR
uniref:Immunoglobulin V-set domain-containing protein n=1 Tax=Neolamprologus brichardi TaxID=32507 RepID=A0A3Q4GTE2_NEOBR